MKQEGTRMLLTEVMWTGGTRNKPCLLCGDLLYLPWPGSALSLLQGLWLPLPLMQICLKIPILVSHRGETLMNPLSVMCPTETCIMPSAKWAGVSKFCEQFSPTPSLGCSFPSLPTVMRKPFWSLICDAGKRFRMEIPIAGKASCAPWTVHFPVHLRHFLQSYRESMDSHHRWGHALLSQLRGC